MIVVYTAKSHADLDRIWQFIAPDSPGRAMTFVRELVQRCERLTDFPYRFPLLRRYEHTGIRRLRHGEYLIFYRVSETQIDILHVIHGAQDYETILFPSDE